MIVNVELDVDLDAQEVIRRLFPRSADNEYELLWVHTEGADYGRKPIKKVLFRLRRTLVEGRT